METKAHDEKSRKSFSFSAIMAFFISLALSGIILAGITSSKLQTDKLTMEQVIMEKTVRLAEIIHKLLYKTEALSALVIQNNGGVSNFDRVAATLLDDPAIANMLIAPNGVVSHVYPLKGNESVLGLNFFAEGAGNQEARMAKETGQLVFGGPFSLVQGGQALVGRLPVYIEDENDEKIFWGLVSVTLKYPQVLTGLGLALLEKQGYAFEIWRVSPDTGEEQIIAKSDYIYNRSARFIEKDINLLNAVWHFRLTPVKMWYYYPETWIVIVIGVVISFLVAFAVQNNHDLKLMYGRLEEMAQSDSLTGIANRRHFMDMAGAQLSHAARGKQSCFVILFDVDHFKLINDSFGHAAGDMVLIELADRVKRIIRPYDLFARYGGEEFILLVMDLEKKQAEDLATRIRLDFCDFPFRFKDTDIEVAASFGLARIAPGENLETAISRADEALYRAKREGRNRVFCYDQA